MRQLLVCILSLLLCSCFASETPRIPQEALSQPGAFSGKFWWLMQDEEFSAGVVEMTPMDGGGFAIAGETPLEVRLVELLGGQTFLYISEEEDNRATYYLLRLLDNGIWELDNISIPSGGPFFAQNLAYARGIAAKYGLEFDDDPHTTEISGTIHGMAIPGLFQDRQFLAALQVQPWGFYLPMRDQPVGGSRETLPDQGRTGQFLGIVGAPPTGEGAACVRGLAGSYADRAALTRGFAQITVREEPGCRYSIDRQDSLPSTLSMLPFDQTEEAYIGIEQWRDEKGEWNGYFWLVQPEADGWTFLQVTRQPAVYNSQFETMRTGSMDTAASRHGLKFSELAEISAPQSQLSAGQILGLMHDGQFTSGLSVLEEPGHWFIRARSLTDPE